MAPQQPICERSPSMSKQRPFGVTVLAVLAGVAALLAIIHTLQLLGLWPFWLGPVRFFTFSLIGAILWGITAAIWIWVVRGLWGLDPQAWVFVVVVSILNLCVAFVSLFGASSFAALLPSILLNVAVLIYALLPGTQQAFGR